MISCGLRNEIFHEIERFCRSGSQCQLFYIVFARISLWIRAHPRIGTLLSISWFFLLMFNTNEAKPNQSDLLTHSETLQRSVLMYRTLKIIALIPVRDMTVSCFILAEDEIAPLEWHTYLLMLEQSYSFSDITDFCQFSVSLFHPRLDLTLMSASPRKTQLVTPLQLFPHTTHTQLSETARTTRIDHHNTIIPPVDLSFQNLDSIAAIQTAFHVRPWEYAGTITILLLWSSNSRSTLAFPQAKNFQHKTLPCLKICYNDLTSIAGLADLLDSLVPGK